MDVSIEVRFNSVLPCHATTFDYNREELLAFLQTLCLKVSVFTCF